MITQKKVGIPLIRMDLQFLVPEKILHDSMCSCRCTGELSEKFNNETIKDNNQDRKIDIT